jgi:hypothetical protein
MKGCLRLAKESARIGRVRGSVGGTCGEDEKLHLEYRRSARPLERNESTRDEEMETDIFLATSQHWHCHAILLLPTPHHITNQPYLNCSQYPSSKPSTKAPSKSLTQPLIPPVRIQTFNVLLLLALPSPKRARSSR